MKAIDPIDKLITEWSWRCKKGYPDLNNPEDMAILKEVLYQYDISLEEVEERIEEQEEVTVDMLVDLIKSRSDVFDQKFLTRMYKAVQNKGKGHTSGIIDILKKKNLDFAIDKIIGSAERAHVEDMLYDYLTGEKKVDVKDLLSASGTSLTDFFKERTNFPAEFLQNILSISAVSRKTGNVGAGEVLLALLLKDGEKPRDKGDVSAGGKDIEVKAGGAPLFGQRETLFKLYEELEERFEIKPGPGATGKGSESLPRYIARIASNVENINTRELNNLVRKHFSYPVNLSGVNLKNIDDINKALKTGYVQEFFKLEPSDYIMYISPKGNIFRTYTPDEFLKAVVDGELKMARFGANRPTPEIRGFN